MSVAQEVFNVSTTILSKSVSQAINGTAPGSVLLASAIVNGASAPFSLPTDTLGLTWNAGPSISISTPVNRLFSMWWALNPAGGNTTVQANWTGSTQQYALFVTEFDGVAAALDGSSSNSQSSAAVGSNTIVSGSGSNAKAPATIYGITWIDLVNFSAVLAGTGFTLLSGADGSSGQLSGVLASEYATLSSAGSQQATFTNNGSQAQPALTLMVMLDSVVAPPSGSLTGTGVAPGVTAAQNTVITPVVARQRSSRIFVPASYRRGRSILVPRLSYAV